MERLREGWKEGREQPCGWSAPDEITASPSALRQEASVAGAQGGEGARSWGSGDLGGLGPLL